MTNSEDGASRNHKSPGWKHTRRVFELQLPSRRAASQTFFRRCFPPFLLNLSGVTLVNKSVRLHNTSSVCCIVCSAPQPSLLPDSVGSIRGTDGACCRRLVTRELFPATPPSTWSRGGPGSEIAEREISM